jgi:hypothetical protein
MILLLVLTVAVTPGTSKTQHFLHNVLFMSTCLEIKPFNLCQHDFK